MPGSYGMRRVLVIGCGGTGKSTFASELGARTGLPVIHLDALYWKAGWTKTPEPVWRPQVEALVRQPAWVMDGNYGGTLDVRLSACDTVVFLDLPRWLCLLRVVNRWRRLRGRSRPDMAADCPERLSWEFLYWIWSYRRLRRPGILERLGRLADGQRAVILRSTVEVREFLAGVLSRAAGVAAVVALLAAGPACARTSSRAAALGESAPAPAAGSYPPLTTMPDPLPPPPPVHEPALTDWATQVYQAVRANWNAPTGVLAEAPDLSAEIRVSIDADGSLREVRMFKSSENAAFDQSCLEAIRTTKRVPPPPASHRSRARKGLVIAFEGKSLPEAVEPP